MNTDNMEILLVEDNPKDVELTLHALRKQNLANHVQVARDGQEALDYFFASPLPGPPSRPRLVLLDLKLPKVSGLEVLRALKADARTKTIPVVVLTSSVQEKDMVESYRLGVNSYLRKPVDFNEFMACTRTLGMYWLLMNNVPRGPS